MTAFAVVVAPEFAEYLVLQQTSQRGIVRASALVQPVIEVHPAALGQDEARVQPFAGVSLIERRRARVSWSGC